MLNVDIGITLKFLYCKKAYHKTFIAKQWYMLMLLK